MGGQAWLNDDSQISNAKQSAQVESNYSMHQATTLFLCSCDYYNDNDHIEMILSTALLQWTHRNFVRFGP